MAFYANMGSLYSLCFITYQPWSYFRVLEAWDPPVERDFIVFSEPHGQGELLVSFLIGDIEVVQVGLFKCQWL